VHQLLSRHMSPAPGRVAVIGRGPGSDVSRLLRNGYDAEVLEPADEISNGLGISRSGTQRALPWKPDSIDVVLMTGPMYSIGEFSERSAVIREAARVLRPGGLLAVVAINRMARLIGATLTNLLLQPSSSEPTDWDIPDRTAVCHTVAELEAELSSVSSRIDIYGLTGPGGWLLDVLDAHFSTACLPASLQSPSPLATALAAAEFADSFPELTYASPLLFAVGQRNEHSPA
jgi:hypothetical protein